MHCNFDMPVYVAELLTSVANIPARSSLCPLVNGDLVVPRNSRMIGERAFSVVAQRAWKLEQTSTELKLLRCTSAFRRKQERRSEKNTGGRVKGSEGETRIRVLLGANPRSQKL